jgi:hypothetical protein
MLRGGFLFKPRWRTGIFFEEHGYFMLFRYGYDENVKVDLGALHYFQTNQILNVAHHCSFRSHEKPGLHH